MFWDIDFLRRWRKALRRMNDICWLSRADRLSHSSVVRGPGQANIVIVYFLRFSSVASLKSIRDWGELVADWGTRVLED